MPCEALIRSGPRAGQQCGDSAYITGGTIPVCRRHHAPMMRNLAYRAAYEAVIAQREQEVREQIQREQRKKQRIYTRYMEKLQTPTIEFVNKMTNDVMELWNIWRIATYDIPKAYTFIKYYTITHEAWLPVLRALGAFVAQVHRDSFASMTAVDKDAHYAAIHTAIAPVGEIDLELITGVYKLSINTRRREEEAARLAAEAAERRVAEEAEFARRLREGPVVFRRDPEGSIDLAAFANDSQNIHRSSVQSTTERIVRRLLERPLLPEQQTLEFVHKAWYEERQVRWTNEERRDEAYTVLTNDYYNTEAFSVAYGDVFDRVWAFIQPSEHKKELCKRLAQEVWEGRGMCSNGKMARLVNVLQGFDDTLEAQPSVEVLRTLFQNKIARVVDMPMEERRAAAEALFMEYNIPVEEHNVWLEPLLEA